MIFGVVGWVIFSILLFSIPILALYGIGGLVRILDVLNRYANHLENCVKKIKEDEKITANVNKE